MRKIITICIIGLFALNVQAQPVKTLKLSDKELLDKIKGGWAGQTIDVVFGAPTEFKFTGTYIQDYQPIPWAEGYVKYWWHDPLAELISACLVSMNQRIISA